jgi:hypothetical protein
MLAVSASNAVHRRWWRSMKAASSLKERCERIKVHGHRGPSAHSTEQLMNVPARQSGGYSPRASPAAGSSQKFRSHGSVASLYPMPSGKQANSGLSTTLQNRWSWVEKSLDHMFAP